MIKKLKRGNEGGEDSPVGATELHWDSQQSHTESDPNSSTHLKKTEKRVDTVLDQLIEILSRPQKDSKNQKYIFCPTNFLKFLNIC